MNLRNGLGRRRLKHELLVMASFEAMQDLLFLSRTSNFIDNEEFFLLSDIFDAINPCFPHEDYSVFFSG